MSFKRVFLIILDSAGIGEEPDAKRFGDEGSNTFVHVSEAVNGLNIPTLESLGIGELADIKGVKPLKDHPNSFVMCLQEASNGKDTMTGHWEMMGINTKIPFQTFTETGFPKELITELEKETGHKVIGNYAASGTEIMKELGERQNKENSLIVYTSSDSVLQILGHEEVLGSEELYRCCKIARKLCMKPEWKVGRVIARPYVGKDKETFKRTPNRHDYALSPEIETGLNILKNNGYMTSGIGKINDIFNGSGITKTVSTISNEDGMDKAIKQLKEEDFEGLCFINLVEFDSEYGHRRNAVGYARALEAFDVRLKEFKENMKQDDLLLISADHGNDPTFKGTDHTREKVPLIAYSPSINNGGHLSDRLSFGDIGASILANFKLRKPDNLIGSVIKELIKED